MMTLPLGRTLSHWSTVTVTAIGLSKATAIGGFGAPAAPQLVIARCLGRVTTHCLEHGARVVTAEVGVVQHQPIYTRSQQLRSKRTKVKSSLL